MPCLHAISSLLEKDRKRRIGAIGWDTFTDNPFFRPIDFIALESKEIMPVFIPSSDKTHQTKVLANTGVINTRLILNSAISERLPLLASVYLERELVGWHS